MIMNWLRTSNIAAGILTVVRVYLGWLWLSAGWGKAFGDEPFNAGGFLARAIENPVVKGGEPVFGWYVSFLESFALPNADLFSFMVAYGEIAVGLGLILGCLTTWAAFFGMVMNFAFVMAGTVSHSPMDIIMEIFIVAAGVNAGKFGLDRWVMPYLKGLIFKSKSQAI